MHVAHVGNLLSVLCVMQPIPYVILAAYIACE